MTTLMINAAKNAETGSNVTVILHVNIRGEQGGVDAGGRVALLIRGLRRLDPGRVPGQRAHHVILVRHGAWLREAAVL